MENEIKSLNELYNRIKPALYSKKIELYKLGLTYIKEEDIWNYLSKNDWANSKDLKYWSGYFRSFSEERMALPSLSAT